MPLRQLDGDQAVVRRVLAQHCYVKVVQGNNRDEEVKLPKSNLKFSGKRGMAQEPSDNPAKKGKPSNDVPEEVVDVDATQVFPSLAGF